MDLDTLHSLNVTNSFTKVEAVLSKNTFTDVRTSTDDAFKELRIYLVPFVHILALNVGSMNPTVASTTSSCHGVTTVSWCCISPHTIPAENTSSDQNTK